MNSNERIVPVHRSFYLYLLHALLPEERWTNNGGIILFVYDYETGDSTKLIFKESNSDSKL